MRNIFRKAVSVLIIMLIFATVFSPAASTASSSNWRPASQSIPFDDVPRHRWEYDVVAWAWANHITFGTSQTTFSSRSNVTRAEFAAFLHRINGYELNFQVTRTFTDVRSTNWFWDPVMWAANNEVVNGMRNPDGTFRFAPNRPIERQEIAAMLHNMMGAPAPAANAETRYNNRFSAWDRNAVSGWARNAVIWAADNGFIGADGVLNARHNATRGEAVAMIYRVVAANPSRFLGVNRTAPFMDVSEIGRAYPSVTEMASAPLISGGLSTSMRKTFAVTDAGMHGFVLTELSQARGSVQIQIQRESPPANSGVFVGITDLLPLYYGEGHGMHLDAGNYQVVVETRNHTAGNFELSLMRQKPISNINESDARNTVRIFNVNDYMVFTGQENEYRFHTPANTGTGLEPASGVYRFDIPRLPTATGVRAVVRLDISRVEGATTIPVHGPYDLAAGEGKNFDLRDNSTYIIRVSHVPISAGTGTVIRVGEPYTLRIGAQKTDTEIRMREVGNNPRISMVNDSFQFDGQMNTYIFTAPETGTFQFRTNLLPGQSHVLMRFSNPWGGVQYQTAGVRGGITVHLHANMEYRLHIIHLEGNPLGAYSFTIIYPE